MNYDFDIICKTWSFKVYLKEEYLLGNFFVKIELMRSGFQYYYTNFVPFLVTHI